MALGAIVHKVMLQVADMNRHYYEDHSLTLARHPSETEERMMVRVLAFACHASAALTFGKGMDDPVEPDLWAKDLTGAITTWIILGQPDEKDIRRACGRAREVILYTYSGHGAEIWWTQNRNKLERLENLTVYNVPAAARQALGRLAQRSMQLQATIQDNSVWISGDQEAAGVELERLTPERFPA